MNFKQAIRPLMLMASFAAILLGQATDANLVGTVSDLSQSGISDATVDLVNTATGIKASTKTTGNGEYRFNNIPAGKYDLSVTAQGFSVYKTLGLIVELNKTSTKNVTLQVGSVATTVDVSENVTSIDTTTAQIQSAFDAIQAVELPTASTGGPGTNFGVYNLSLLSAGVSSSGAVGVGIGPSIGGQRPRNNNFNVEGVDNNRKDVTGPVVYIPNEAVGEFSLLQNQFSAEFGHSSGGQFNQSIRSGTNAVHGSIYEYFQNRNLNAVDQLLANTGVRENPRFDQNRLGATVGGPIIKNKWFFFGSYEYEPLGQASTPGGGVSAPTAAGLASLANIPGVSQTNLGVFKQYVPVAPVANDSTIVNGVSIPIGILPLASPNFLNQKVWLASTDYNFSERDSLRIRYVRNGIDQIDNTPNLPVFYGTLPTTTHLFSLGEFHNFTPNLINEFRFGYNRYNNTVVVGDFKFPGLDKFPNITIDNDLNLQIGPDPNGPGFTVLNTYQVVDNVSWTRGNHTLKFGFDGRKLIAPQQFTQRSRGDYNYSNLERFLLDQSPDDLSERGIDLTPYYGDQISTYWYANDNWKIRRNLSLNFGVRYEYTTVPFGERLQRLNSLSSIPGVIQFKEPTAQKTNVSPRIGIAYSPGTAGTTSIRVGFGMANDVLFDNIGTLEKPPQFSTTIDTDLNTTTPNFLKNGGIRATYAAPQTAAEARSLTAAYIPDQVLPRSISWNVGIQQILAKNYTLEVRYLGNRGYKLITQERINRTSAVTQSFNLPTYVTRPSQGTLDALPVTLAQIRAVNTNSYAQYGFDQNITAYLANGNSTYNGLAIQLNRRFTNGLQFVGAYTWSHLIDDSTTEFFATVATPRRAQDFNNLSSDKASSALDRRQRFSFSTVYDLPAFRSSSNWFKKNLIGNWLASGTYTYESPEYATVQSAADANFNGDTAGDRSIINVNGQDRVGSDVTALKNSKGDTVGYLANNPNARYIRAGLGAFANAGRNTLPLRHITNFDLSLQKKFSISERMRFEFGAQAFNAFNHPQFVPGTLNNINATSFTSTRSFLTPGNANFNNLEFIYSSQPRVLQLVGRFVF